MENTVENNIRKEIAEVLKKYNASLYIDDGGGEISGEILFDVKGKSCGNTLAKSNVGDIGIIFSDIKLT